MFGNYNYNRRTHAYLCIQDLMDLNYYYSVSNPEFAIDFNNILEKLID